VILPGLLILKRDKKIRANGISSHPQGLVFAKHDADELGLPAELSP